MSRHALNKIDYLMGIEHCSLTCDDGKGFKVLAQTLETSAGGELKLISV